MKRAFVIGHPIAHSKSPLLHGHWLEEHKIDGSYQALDVDPADLSKFVQDLKAGALVGGNVTVPHKETVMALCDRLTDTAKKIGAVNTLWLQDGQLFGDNSDKYGFLANLDQQLPNWDAQKETALVLGAGGAARAILVGLAERRYKKILVLNRTLERAAALCDQLNIAFSSDHFSAAKLSTFNELVQNSDLIVNTSAVGMGGTKFDNIDLARAPKHAIVSDIVYTPLETPLLVDAKQASLRTVDGVGMLLHQAVLGFERWFGVRPEVSDELRKKILGEKT